jgi:hypothetical protein
LLLLLLLCQEVKRDRDTKVLTSLVQLKVGEGGNVADRVCTYMLRMVVMAVTRMRHMHWSGWGKLLLLRNINKLIVGVVVAVAVELQTHQLLVQVVVVVGTRPEDGDTHSTTTIRVTITLAINIGDRGASA